MPVITLAASEALTQIDRFDAVVDARSEGEFALDHLPRALNWPSLTNEERIVVGTEYKQISPFVAQKRGAALVARNIARHIEREVMDKPKDWSPLIYCWRGGKRSGSLALVLGQIGFRVHMLEGGYRAFRSEVVKALESAGSQLRFQVLCGTTGSGKSRLLQALKSAGAQVLDLEDIAQHRGSVLGLVPGTLQPTQKRFETLLWNELRQFDVNRPVFVESESRTVGQLRVPERLIQTMRAAPCIAVDMELEERVNFLMRDYAHFVNDAEFFCKRLDALRDARGHQVVNDWHQRALAGQMNGVVRDLLQTHYDPIYLKSMQRNFAQVNTPLLRVSWDGTPASLQHAVSRLLSALT
ncbi:MAG: tRNA 2-selenouridine(34) synthase MnmH [Rhizobacter sp.]